MDTITRARNIIEDALAAGGGLAHMALLCSFGKDSLVTCDLLGQYGIRTCLVLEDDKHEEAVDPVYVGAVIERYGLTVLPLSHGRAIFAVVQGQPFLTAYVFVNDRVMTPFPMTILPYHDGNAEFGCVDDELRATQGIPQPVPVDSVFAGFKREDATKGACPTFVDLLPPARQAAYVARLQPHMEVAPGLPLHLPLFDWTDADVWDYIRARDLPWSRLMYDDQGNKRQHGAVMCYRCHDPNEASIVDCPKIGKRVVNLAALTHDTDLQLERLRRMGLLSPADQAALAEVA